MRHDERGGNARGPALDHERPHQTALHQAGQHRIGIDEQSLHREEQSGHLGHTTFAERLNDVRHEVIEKVPG